MSFKYIAPIEWGPPVPLLDQLSNLDLGITNVDQPSLIRRLFISYDQEFSPEFPYIIEGNGRRVIIDQERWDFYRSEYRKYTEYFGKAEAYYHARPVPTDIRANILDSIGSDITDRIGKYIQDIIIQVTYYGGLWPHSDLLPPGKHRDCSIFISLTSSEYWETSWWRSRSEVEIHRKFQESRYFWPFPGFDDIQLGHVERLERYRTYIFDNHSYHSTRCLEYHEPRRALCINFQGITAGDLYEIMK